MTTATRPITTLDEFEQEFRTGVGQPLGAAAALIQFHLVAHPLRRTRNILAHNHSPPSCHAMLPQSGCVRPRPSRRRLLRFGGRHGSDELLHLGGERLAHAARIFDEQGNSAPIQSAAVGMAKHVAEAAH